MRGFVLPLLLLAACQERSDIDTSRGSTTPAYERGEATIDENRLEMPVRIGESGPSFSACTARGTTRLVAQGDALAVRTGPFQGAREIARLPAGAGFFVCTRSIDQRWLGIVFDETGAAQCGVSAPVASRRAYDGPCRSGWVASASVRLTGA